MQIYQRTVQKTIHKPAPVGVAVVDNDEEHAVKLDANFDETWGFNLPYRYQKICHTVSIH